uniref:Uncharacterized protein n=1 Tax=Salix viminalis TaxID=40686 RepID=A0A6N2N9B9_SALVM
MSGWGGMIYFRSFTRTIRRGIAPREVLLPMDKTLNFRFLNLFFALWTRLYIEDWIGLKTLDEAQQMIKAVPSYNRLSTIKNFSMEIFFLVESNCIFLLLSVGPCFKNSST